MGFALVNVYKKKEVLWNPQHCEYHQKNKRNDSWQEVADELSAIIQKPVPALECKRKMDTFLSSFRRERVKKRKISETTEGDSDRSHGATWFLFDALSFLIDKEVIRRPPKNPVSNRDEPNANPPLSKVSGSKQSEDDRTEKLLKSVKTPNEDECYSYGMFVANKLKRYSAHTRSAVQHAMSNILYNADMGHYNQSSSVSVNTQTEPNPMECIWLQQDENEFKNEAISDVENEGEIFN
ncbi:hypothetical protein WH47_09028 [Habropoda laboriosa]|uniref:MADF domain-containing protein n=2 Tax=Habropoda laboriosa TaxID=597456 RepID=A0A0L7QLX3_9HYME|nr:hypothetical protein WH47_09028 [Habropoda laboriosa]